MRHKFFIINLLISLQLYGAVDWEKIVEEVSVPSTNYCFTAIDGGASNINYALFLNDLSYFIRFAPKKTTAPYADLSIEYETLCFVGDLGVSSKPIYYDENKRVLVTEFINHNQEEIDLLDPETRSGVISLLHKIEHSSIQISRRFQPYRDVLTLVEEWDVVLDGLQEILLPMLQRIDFALAKNEKKSLCHLDLHNKNLLRTSKQFWIVDWEYAAMSHPFLVLASMASIERWSDEQMNHFLRDYVEFPNEEDFYRLYLYRIVADIFWTVWNHIQVEHSPIDNPYAVWEELFYNAALERIYSQTAEDAIAYLIKIELFRN